MALSNNMVIKQILERRSVRQFGKKEVPEEHIIEIIKAGQFAPSAMGNHATEFVVVTNPEIKDAIYQIVGQDFVKEAPVLIIPVTDTTKTNCSVKDLSVVSENMFLQAVELGLGTVWKNLSGEGEKKVKKLLGIPEHFRVINIIPVGYPKENIKPHDEGEFDLNKIHREDW